MHYTKLKQDTEKIKWLEKVGGRWWGNCNLQRKGREPSMKNRQAKGTDLCSWNAYYYLREMTAIRTKKPQQTPNMKKQSRTHEQAEKHLPWYLGNDRNTLPHESSIKDELDHFFGGE